jgi:hypothetical protein
MENLAFVHIAAHGTIAPLTAKDAFCMDVSFVRAFLNG